jgi:UDP-glucose 4-epimerase
MFGGEQSQLQSIGFRHGEKLYESLLSVEERAKAEDKGGYFRVPLDARDLNYSLFFEEGESRPQELEAYTSHNTDRLNVEQVKELLLTIPEVRQELGL